MPGGTHYPQYKTLIENATLFDLPMLDEISKKNGNDFGGIREKLQAFAQNKYHNKLQGPNLEHVDNATPYKLRYNFWWTYTDRIDNDGATELRNIAERLYRILQTISNFTSPSTVKARLEAFAASPPNLSDVAAMRTALAAFPEIDLTNVQDSELPAIIAALIEKNAILNHKDSLLANIDLFNTEEDLEDLTAYTESDEEYPLHIIDHFPTFDKDANGTPGMLMKFNLNERRELGNALRGREASLNKTIMNLENISTLTLHSNIDEYENSLHPPQSLTKATAMQRHLGYDTPGIQTKDIDRLHTALLHKRTSLTLYANTINDINKFKTKADQTKVADYLLQSRTNLLEKQAALAKIFPARMTSKLDENDLDRIHFAIIEKGKTLTNTHNIKDAIDTYRFDKPDEMRALKNYLEHPHPTPGEKRQALLDNILDLARIVPDLSSNLNNETILTDAQVEYLHTVIEERYNSLSIADKILTNLNSAEIRTGTPKFKKDVKKVLSSIVRSGNDAETRVAIANAARLIGFSIPQGRSTLDGLLANKETQEIKDRTKQVLNLIYISEAIESTRQATAELAVISSLDGTQLIDGLNKSKLFANLPITRPITLTADDLQIIRKQAGAKYDALRTKPVYANVLRQTKPDPGLREFRSFFWKAGENEPEYKTAAAASSGTTVSVLNGIDCFLKGEKLLPGDKILTKAEFPEEKRDGVLKKAEARLYQDDTGAVIDMTTDTLTTKEQEKIAVSQAQLVIHNLILEEAECKRKGEKPKEHTLYIDEGTPDQANRVCAAILMLKGNLKFKIVSHVRGCEAPAKKDVDAFIANHLKEFNPSERLDFQTRSKAFIEKIKKEKSPEAGDQYNPSGMKYS